MKAEKIKVTQVNNQLTLTMPAKLRRKSQRHAVTEMLKRGELSAVVSYLRSQTGQASSRIVVPRMRSSGTDKLAVKTRNTVERAQNALFDLEDAHVPMGSSTDWIGVEIECCIPKDSVTPSDGTRECGECSGSGQWTDEDDCEHDCDYCSATGRIDSDDADDEAYHNGLRRRFKQLKIKRVNIKSDGSINTPDDADWFAAEITVLTRLSSPQNLRDTCAFLKDLGATVNRSCGLHVHLDSRHLNGDQAIDVGLRFHRALPVMLAMVPRSRRENSYCQPKVSGLRGDRYAAVNMTAFTKFRTIEVRLHSSTTDFTKIMNWARFVKAIATASALDGGLKKLQSINELIEFVAVPEELVEYISQRTSLFSSDSTESEAVPESFTDEDSTDDIELAEGA